MPRPSCASRAGDAPPERHASSRSPRPTWGGRRAGAGRPRGKRPPVPHRTRPAHRPYQPVHVTLRRAKGLPSFRCEGLHRLLLRAIRDTGRARGDSFRVVHYSIQADHLHVIVEADDRTELSNGMRSFAIRIALRVNRLLDRKRGKVWGDRHHRRDLTTPSEVRNALVYVLSNHLKHGEIDVGLVDPYSTGPWFEGWLHGLEPPPPKPSIVRRATTWLLRKGWETHGFIHRGELPRAARAPR